MIHLLDAALLDSVSREAALRPRRRLNHNFHPVDGYPGHRLLNAIEPDSYLPPHRHLDPNKDESIIVLRGALGFVEFDDDGAAVARSVMTPGGDCCGVDIPHGIWHTVIALEPGTVMFEAKSGPYQPLTAEERAAWAPPEGDATAIVYWQSIAALFDEG